MRLVHPRQFCLVAMAGLIIFASGCSASAPTGTLQGKVTYEDKPVTAATLQFQSSQTGAAIAANVDPNGSYKIETPVALGTYSAIVLPFNDAPPAGSTPTPPKPKERPDIPTIYRASNTSPLTVTIKAGVNTFDVKMTSKP